VTASPHLGLDRLRTELDQAARQLSCGLDGNPFARIEAGELLLSRRDALEIPATVRELRRVIESHLPRTRIEDLLVDVDNRCGFTGELVPASGYTPRLENQYATLLAALVAHGTNLGIATMAQSTRGMTVDMLHEASRWWLRPECLKAANRVLVDYHHRLELSCTTARCETVSSYNSTAESHATNWRVACSSPIRARFAAAITRKS